MESVKAWKYIKGTKGLCYSNLMFEKSYPLWSKDHPCHENKIHLMWKELDDLKKGIQGNDPLSKFRAAGYFASCFPEGDGIAFEALKYQSEEQIIKDIESIFGVDVYKK